MALKIMLVSFSILISCQSYAQLSEKECSDVDIRDKNPTLKDFFSKPRNQDSIGWCYGFAAADLISVELGVPVSSFHTSAIYNKSVSKNPIMKTLYGIGRFLDKHSNNPNLAFKEIYETGLLNQAIKEVGKEGFVCPETEAPFDRFHGETIAIIRSLESLKDYLKSTEHGSAQKCEKLRADLPTLSDPQLAQLYQILLSDNLNEELDKIISSSCKNSKLVVPKFKIKNIYPPMFDHDKDMVAEKKQYFSKIGEVLKSGKPIGISYNTRHVTEMNGEHVSVVTARRWHNDKCEYKVRNSWGQSCSDYKKGIECNRNEGSYWVDENKFYDMVDDVSYISK